MTPPQDKTSPLTGPTRTILLTVLLGVLCGGGIIAYLVTASKPATSQKAELPPAVDTLTDLPIKWAEHNEDTTPITIAQGAQGPVLKHEELTLDLGLHIKGATPFLWKTSSSQGNIVLTGDTTLYDVPITLQWIFRANDPQVTLLIDLHDAPLTALNEPITASLTLPQKANYQAVRHTMTRETLSSRTTLDSWTPGWLRITLPSTSSIVTISEWTVASLTVAPDASQEQLAISIWDPASSPSFKDCEKGERKTISMRQHLTFTFGERLALVPSRYEQGYRAAIAPLFIDAASHNAREHKDGRATSAQDWVSRSKTLLYGHSSEQDPRFGNGGLLGLGLGADVALEAGWSNAPEVAALSAQLHTSRARQLTREPTSEAPNKGEGVLLGEPHCAPFLGHAHPYLTLGPPRSMDELDVLAHPPTLELNGAKTVRTFPNIWSEFAPSFEVPQLSGRRQVLSDAVFSTQALEQLIKDRGMMVFATPLIATRNPLTPSATQALLEPERGGHWTLSEPFSRSLTNVELLNENHELLVTSPTLLMQHWQQTRQVQIMEMPDGSFALINPLDTPIVGFTLVANGNLSPQLPSGEELTGREVVTARDGSSQTWFWWTLAPGTTRITPSDDAQHSSLPPVVWQLLN